MGYFCPFVSWNPIFLENVYSFLSGFWAVSTIKMEFLEWTFMSMGLWWVDCQPYWVYWYENHITMAWTSSWPAHRPRCLTHFLLSPCTLSYSKIDISLTFSVNIATKPEKNICFEKTLFGLDYVRSRIADMDCLISSFFDVVWARKRQQNSGPRSSLL